MSKVIAKLCDAAGMVGRYSNYSLCLTAATHMYDWKIDEQQITEVTGHKSVVVRNYKRMSMTKQCEVSDVLYGKHKTAPSATISKAEANFELGIDSQGVLSGFQSNVVKTDIALHPMVNMETPKVDIKVPVFNFQQPEITVNPVVNLCMLDLSRNDQGQIILPPIKVTLTININAPKA